MEPAFSPPNPFHCPNKILTSAGLSRLSVALEIECPIVLFTIRLPSILAIPPSNGLAPFSKPGFR